MAIDDSHDHSAIQLQFPSRTCYLMSFDDLIDGNESDDNCDDGDDNDDNEDDDNGDGDDDGNN